MNSLYLDRYAWGEVLFPDYSPSEELAMILVLPAFNEPNIEVALDSLSKCISPEKEFLIIVVINESVKANGRISEVNEATMNVINSYRSRLPLLVSYQKLPANKAGVGLARKIGMDEAVRIFRNVGNDGAIICYDADTVCDENFLVTLEDTYFNDDVKAGIVFYEHQLHREHHREIVNYELYLRYYINALRFTGFPYAYQTLGSCITVRCSHYEKVGGMNTRKAGEDFYFLNKTIPLGGFIEINETTVRPSDRISNRVPFGTGKAVNEIKQQEVYEVYHPNIFEDLKLFFSQVKSIWEEVPQQLPKTIESFLGSDWRTELESVKNQVSSLQAFEQRFFHWFDAFKILKFVHFARDHFYQNIELQDALEWLRSSHSMHLKGDLSAQLIQLRYFDRNWS